MTRKDELSEVMMEGLKTFQAFYNSIDKEKVMLVCTRKELRDMFVTGYLFGAEYLAVKKIKKSLEDVFDSVDKLCEEMDNLIS